MQNASLVDASAQGTRNLNQLAKNLSGMMSQFHLEDCALHPPAKTAMMARICSRLLRRLR